MSACTTEKWYKMGPIALCKRPGDYEIFIGPYVGRFLLNLSPKTGFLWRDGQWRITNFIRRFWSGWHRWKDDEM